MAPTTTSLSSLSVLPMLLALSSLCIESLPPIVSSETGTDDLQAMHDALDRLWTGSREDQLLVALNAEALFEPLDWESGARNQTLDRVVASLRDYLAMDGDEWVEDRLVAGLAEIESERLIPLFLELLGDSSPHLRHRAAEHFTMVEEPEAIPLLLERLNKERRPWILVDLLEALDHHDVEDHAETCLEFASHKDNALAVAALECLFMLEPPGTAQRLIESAQDGSCEVRVEALDDLVGLDHPAPPDQQLQVVFEAIDALQSPVQAAAIRALERIEDPQAWAKLVELARAHAPGTLAGDTAARTLWNRDAPTAKAIAEEWAARRPIATHVCAMSRSAQLECPPSRRPRLTAGATRTACQADPGKGPQRDEPIIHRDAQVDSLDHVELDTQLWEQIDWAGRSCWVRLEADRRAR